MFSPHTQIVIVEVIQVLIDLIVLIVLQYICISDCHIVHLKLIQCCMSIIPQ